MQCVCELAGIRGFQSWGLSALTPANTQYKTGAGKSIEKDNRNHAGDET
jgi:hypothetical protein